MELVESDVEKCDIVEAALWSAILSLSKTEMCFCQSAMVKVAHTSIGFRLFEAFHEHYKSIYIYIYSN